MSLEKIMVVDDDPNICELLRLYLEKEGYTVEIVNDGMAAVEAFQSAQPDLVLLDIMLPRLDAGRSAGKSAVFRTSRLLC